jgi:hypothetical protein
MPPDCSALASPVNSNLGEARATHAAKRPCHRTDAWAGTKYYDTSPHNNEAPQTIYHIRTRPFQRPSSLYPPSILRRLGQLRAEATLTAESGKECFRVKSPVQPWTKGAPSYRCSHRIDNPTQ